MSLKLPAVENKYLKKYIITVYRIKAMPPDKMKKTAAQLKKQFIPDENIYKALIEKNLKMSLSMAALYRGAGVDFAALITAANKGLIKAVKEWSKSEEQDFESFIIWKTEQSVISRIIRSRKKEIKKVKNNKKGV
ncbi:MAG: hypothetical protein ACLFP1_01185 [Candidatus Goldiibacteriota bacterium]